MFCRALNCRRLGLLNELLVKTRILRNQACNSNKIYLPLDSNVSTVSLIYCFKKNRRPNKEIGNEAP